MSVRLSTAKRRPLDTCPVEARQKICRKITNTQARQDHRHRQRQNPGQRKVANRRDELVGRAFRHRLRGRSLSRRLFRRPRNAAEGAGEGLSSPGYLVFAPGALIRHIETYGVMAIEIPPWFDPAETLLFAAACIKSGRVKFCPPTIDKMAIHPLGAALNFTADDPVDAALQGAFLAAISLKFDHQLSSRPKLRA